MSLSTNNVVKLPFADNSAAGHNRAGEHTAQEQHALLMLDIEYKHTFEDYVRDLHLTHEIPASDAEKIVETAFIMARNNVSTFKPGIPAHEYLEQYVEQSHELYIQCSKHHKNELEDSLAQDRLNEAINSVTKALVDKGLNEQQAMKRIADFLNSLSENEKEALIDGTAADEDIDRYDRILSIMSHPGPRVVVNNPQKPEDSNGLKIA